jgi:single-strand DNA-binding protein
MACSWLSNSKWISSDRRTLRTLTTNQVIGSLVLVEGRLVCDLETGGPRIYARKDGTPGAAFEVNASIVRFLSGQENPEAAQEGAQNGADPRYGDIPF